MLTQLLPKSGEHKHTREIPKKNIKRYVEITG
jgi:hypothetical protein